MPVLPHSSDACSSQVWAGRARIRARIQALYQDVMQVISSPKLEPCQGVSVGIWWEAQAGLNPRHCHMGHACSKCSSTYCITVPNLFLFLNHYSYPC